MDMRLGCLLLLLLLPIAFAQPGYLSIECCASSSTTDPTSHIQWNSDSHLIGNLGTCRNATVPKSSFFTYKTARVFTKLKKSWCYNLPVVQGQDYLLRATFLYGPYFRSIRGTSFNLSVGTTSLARIDSSLNIVEVEVLFAASNNHTKLCLLREKGNAYISMIELRPLIYPIYLDGSYSILLKMVRRVALGNPSAIYGYPKDLADRIWDVELMLNHSYLKSSEATLLGANRSVPLEVLQNARMDPARLEFLYDDLDMSPDDYLIVLFFLELDSKVKIAERIFDIYVNNERKYERMDILLNASNYKEVRLRVTSNGSLNISLVGVSGETKYGPICNAYEIFQVFPKAAETIQRDAIAMEELKNELLVENKENWILEDWYSDPCMPQAWHGVFCKERNHSLVVNKLDLSSKGFRGQLPPNISNLAELEELDVQYNYFIGSVPNSFASLLYLSKLSLGCNPDLNNQLPSELISRMNLTVDYGTCSIQEASQTPSQRISAIGSITGGSVAISLVVSIFFICFYKRARQPDKRDYPALKNAAFSMSSISKSYSNPIVQSFTLEYIENATCNYRTMIGEGGFGPVYRGTLPDGEEVAVKVRSATSTQGLREFDNEVTFLSAIRHENLVPLLGYCCENDQQILVYPFMSNGSLQDRLYGEASKKKVLDWSTRLSIALGAARGITYLHNFAGRCIIHRDIKSSNILLDHSMCGKVADFGFSKYAPQEGDSGASLEVRGTAGYLDPEYYSTQQLSIKSDVFSFGVVLLEIITGREPLNIQRPRNEWSLVEWAKPLIRESRIDEIVDPSIRGGYHAEAMWRVVEATLACVEPFSTYRPNMVDIVRELEDALIIENNASEYMRSLDSLGGGGSNRYYCSIERKILPPISSPVDPSPNYCPFVPGPQPR